MSDEEVHKNKSTVVEGVKEVIGSVFGKLENGEQAKANKETAKDNSTIITPRSNSTPQRQSSRSESNKKTRHRNRHHKRNNHQENGTNHNNNNGNSEQHNAELKHEQHNKAITPPLDLTFANKLQQRRAHGETDKHLPTSYSNSKTNMVCNGNNNNENYKSTTPRPHRSGSAHAGTSSRTTSHHNTPRFSVSLRSASVRSSRSSANSTAQILHRAAVVSSVRYFTAKRAASITNTIGLMEDDSMYYLYNNNNDNDNNDNNNNRNNRVHGRSSSSAGSHYSGGAGTSYSASMQHSIRPPSGELTQAEIFALERMAENDARRNENLERAALLEEERAQYLQQSSEEKENKAQSYLQALLEEQRQRIASLRAWRKEHTNEILTRHEQLEEERQLYFEKLVINNSAPLDAFQLMYAKQLYHTPQLRATSPVALRRQSRESGTLLLHDNNDNVNENEDDVKNEKLNKHRSITPHHKQKINSSAVNHNHHNSNIEHKTENDEDNEDAEAFLNRHINNDKHKTAKQNKKSHSCVNNHNTHQGHTKESDIVHENEHAKDRNAIEEFEEEIVHHIHSRHDDDNNNNHNNNNINTINHKVYHADETHREKKASTPRRRRRHSRNVNRTPIRAWH